MIKFLETEFGRIRRVLFTLTRKLGDGYLVKMVTQWFHNSVSFRNTRIVSFLSFLFNSTCQLLICAFGEFVFQQKVLYLHTCASYHFQAILFQSGSIGPPINLCYQTTCANLFSIPVVVQKTCIVIVNSFLQICRFFRCCSPKPKVEEKENKN